MFVICRMTVIVFCILLAHAAGGQDWVGDITRDIRQDAGGGAPLPVVRGGFSGPVAVVGHGRIGWDEVFELWTPMWREVQSKVRNGKMPPEEGDRVLLGEWEKVVFALVKDETLYQEMEREHASYVNSIVDSFVRGGDPRPRNQVMTDIRARIDQNMQAFFRELNYQVVKDSGGAVKLYKVLENRGLSVAQWQARLEKKAFTQTYLQQILNPRAPTPGPRQVQEYYASHPEEFAEPGLVRFRHIFFSSVKRGPETAREAAVAAWEALVDEEISFADAAAELSDDPVSSGRGGLETEAEAEDPEREAWLADIRNALREESPGVVGPILESPFGYHVAVLEDIGPDRKIAFAEVRDEIRAKLMSERWEEETNKFFHSVRQKTDITVLSRTPPDALSCRAMSGQEGRGARVYSTAFPEAYYAGGVQ